MRIVLAFAEHTVPQSHTCFVEEWGRLCEAQLSRICPGGARALERGLM